MHNPQTKIGKKNLLSETIAIKAIGTYPTIEEDLTAKLKVIASVKIIKDLSKNLGLMFKKW
jgi:hypothetical protein